MNYYGRRDDEARWVNEILSTAKKLKFFDTYEFRVSIRMN